MLDLGGERCWGLVWGGWACGLERLCSFRLDSGLCFGVDFLEGRRTVVWSAGLGCRVLIVPVERPIVVRKGTWIAVGGSYCQRKAGDSAVGMLIRFF